MSNRITADEVEHGCQVWLRRLSPLYRATRGPSIRYNARQFHREGLIETEADLDTFLCGIELERLRPGKLADIMNGGSADAPAPQPRKPKSVRDSLMASIDELRS
jgi:hypothetical protein